ncbi:MAG: DNRLRE domain-containing protein, partial [Armatimonadota bacterium]
MFRRSRRLALGICLLTVIAVSLGLGAALAPTPAMADAASEQRATVVREEPGKRAEYSTSYLMSDGTNRTVFSQGPVHYLDENGLWQNVDTSLLPVAGLEVYETVAAPVTVSLADEGPGQQPVTVTSDRWQVSMSLLGCAEDDKLVFDDAAIYTDVARDTDVTYTALGDGLKEVITLNSAAAPNRFTYRLLHPGLELRRDAADQEWALFTPGQEAPVFSIGAMNVCDSSRDAIDEPAWCPAAQMTVTPGIDESTITFTVPRAWLTSSARAYPVMIDPNIGTEGTTADTYLSQGLPSTSFGSLNEAFCGRMNSDADKCRTLVRFPQVSTSTSVGAHIKSASFQLYEYWQPATHTDAVCSAKLASSSISWTENSTYNGANNGLNIDYTYPTQDVTAGNWLSVDCRSAVQSWKNGQTNQGFIVYEPDASGSGHSRKFRTRDYPSSSAWPKLIVDSETPSMTTSGAPATAHVGDNLSVTVTASGATASDITSLQLGMNRAAGVASRYRGYLGWFATNAQLSGWSAPQAVSSGSGYSAYTTATGDNNSAITLVSCTHAAGSSAATFTYQVKDQWSILGDVQDTSFDARMDMSSGSQASWSSGWFSGGQAMDLLVSPVPGTVGATPAPVATDDPWFVSSQPNDDAVKARCKIDLSWSRAPGAAGYKVFLATGTTFQEVASVASTATELTWSTLGKGLFPSGSALRGLLTGADAWKNVPQGYAGNVFKDFGTGLELRDNPKELYNRINPAGSGALQDSQYHFR